MLASIITMFRSEDRSDIRVGCALAKENKLAGIGYNAYQKQLNPINLCGNSKQILHAEQNAILFRSDYSLKACSVYSTRMPCDECWPLVAQLEPARILFWEIPYEKEKGRLKDGYKLHTSNVKTFAVEIVTEEDLKEIRDFFAYFELSTTGNNRYFEESNANYLTKEQ